MQDEYDKISDWLLIRRSFSFYFLCWSDLYWDSIHCSFSCACCFGGIAASRIAASRIALLTSVLLFQRLALRFQCCGAANFPGCNFFCFIFPMLFFPYTFHEMNSGVCPVWLPFFDGFSLNFNEISYEHVTYTFHYFGNFYLFCIDLFRVMAIHLYFQLCYFFQLASVSLLVFSKIVFFLPTLLCSILCSILYLIPFCYYYQELAIESDSIYLNWRIFPPNRLVFSLSHFYFLIQLDTHIVVSDWSNAIVLYRQIQLIIQQIQFHHFILRFQLHHFPPQQRCPQVHL